jgi:Concanavalin A-like lectin/glucanases superfamily
MRSQARHSGLALVLVMVLVAAATVLGLAALARSSLKLACSDNLRQAERARYLAESGLQHGLHILETWPVLPTVAQGPCTIDSSSDSYQFKVGPSGGDDCYAVLSYGQVGAIRQSCQTEVKAASRYLSLMLALNPEHYWRLGETSGVDAHDLIDDWTAEYKEHVQLGQEGAIIRDGDSSAFFGGDEDYVDLKKIDLHGIDCTIVSWIWPYSYDNLSDNDARIVSKADGVSRADHYWMLSTRSVGAQTRLRFRLRTNGSVEELLAWTGDVKLQQWTFAVAVYDGSHMKLYQDGVLVGSCNKWGFINQNDGVKSWIGGNPSDKHDRPWWGRIDEVAFFDYALSEAQIRALYEARHPEMTLLQWTE